jgi:site-specific DNA-methyltransferase (adenine-specific)
VTAEIVHADALWLPRLAAEFDSMIVDPPYSDAVHRNAVSTGTGGAGPRKRDLGFEALSPELFRRLCQYAAQVRRWSAIFCDLESVGAWRQGLTDAGAEYVRAVPWVRWTQPQISGDRPPSGCEMVVLAHRPGRKRWSGPGSLTHFHQKALRGADKHPTEKPLDLMLALVSYLSDPGEAVFDPCAGSGTTVLGAALLDREALGLERSAGWAGAYAARGSSLAMPPAADATALRDRDAERLRRFVVDTRDEASAVPEPKAANGSDVKTYERAQRRLADAARAAQKTGVEE